jgi:hypothetical protein
MSFDTQLTLRGPLRQPRQMLAQQEYGGHASIHDDATAERLGLRAGPIEGPTHFSLFPPLLAKIWGQAWFERGCISSHYLNMVVEGEAVRAFADVPPDGATSTRVWAEKEDGTPVLEASASIGPGETLLDQRMRALRPPERLLILADLKVGMTGARDEAVRMDADQHMGALYPFRNWRRSPRPRPGIRTPPPRPGAAPSSRSKWSACWRNIPAARPDFR